MTTAPSDAAVELAETYLATRNYRRAEDVLRTALAADPQHAGLLTAFADAKLRQEDYAAAATSAQAALASAPDHLDAMRVYAYALEGLGRWPEALDTAYRGVVRHPHSHAAHYYYARLLDAAGHPTEALTVANEALRLSPNDADTLVVRGDCYFALNQSDSAEADYREALRLEPENVYAMYSLAALDFAQLRRWTAIDRFLGAARVDAAHGDTVREIVGLLVSHVLRRSTWTALVTALAVVWTFVQQSDGDSTWFPRTVAGIGAFCLFVTYTRLMHYNLPRPVLRTILRDRKLLVVRAVLVFGGVVLGVQTAILGAGLLSTGLATLMLLGVPLLVVVGRIGDEKLW